MDGPISEQEISMVLNTYMYVDYDDANDGQTLREIVEEMPLHTDVNGTYAPQYSILKEAVKNPETGDLIIGCQSGNMGYNEGTNAVTFSSSDGSRVYVVYRGTYDGEWMDNGEGLSKARTEQQMEAVDYFETVVNRMGLDGDERLVVSGHSKGANKAQFVTMESRYSDRIDRCYSIDGQGQSKKAVKSWKDRLGSEEYVKRTGKLYGINGENDYVSVLGCSIIPAAHVLYVKTGTAKADFAGYHDITRMFATVGHEAGKTVITYNGRKNPYVFKRGPVGDFIGGVSDEVMNLPEDALKGCASGAMQIPEVAFGGIKTGLNGQKASLSDLKHLGKDGVGVIIGRMYNTKAGKKFYSMTQDGGYYGHSFSDADSIYVDYGKLGKKSDELKKIAKDLEDASHTLESSAYELSFYLDNVLIKEERIKLYLGGLATGSKSLLKTADLLEEVVNACSAYDAGLD
ncbi:MAG: DUF2974 domain-containing protein [Lachnospiraceae bacterium]|nr:DUF2974 domain-containing protein [Lachnospiraceae bacterium]